MAQSPLSTKLGNQGVPFMWDDFKQSNIHIIGVPEGEEKEQEIGNLFEKEMKGNFLNLVKEIDMHRESQTRWMQRGPLQNTS